MLANPSSARPPAFLLRLTESGWFWPLLLGLNLALHLPFFQQPPNSAHVWRQSNTMAVARNFAEEDMNILRPRVDRRRDTDGVTGMQFPSYEWVVALNYRVFGVHEAIPRVVNWLIFAAGLVGFYGLVRQLSGLRWLAAVGAWGLAWSPELFYHSINALPDVLALSASLWGLWFFLRWYGARGRSTDFGISLLAVALAGATKLQYLVVGAPMAVVVVQDLVRGRLSSRRLGWLALFGLVAVGLPVTWYAYALHLIDTSGLTDFGLEVRSATSLATALAILKDNLVSDTPELLLGFATFGLLLLGLGAVVGERKWQHPWFGPLLGWALALLAYHLLELRQMDAHQYYMLPHVPVLLLVAVVGAGWLSRQRARWAAPLLVLLLVAQPVLAWVRIVPARWLHGPRELAPELYYEASRAQLRAAAPDSALCLVGPDNSGCIYFYFLHKKGFGFSGRDDLFARDSTGQTYLTTCLRGGVHYLYTDDSVLVTDPRLGAYRPQLMEQVGRFRVLRFPRDSAARRP
ncbi:ArnT family glycosyltransferase [Hymenobacter rubripertinctus]|uniref:Glycosyltransferase RgtA/B/C/D-like domain-containing protein n=1 Tax=Hymenobacter rubripertinctus TaxID=2029981 RepID=A0A418R6E9_9BACT|nr:glycosyltransferase family 39 protein [Hymenobacter rubripertinctus]RIY12905.1 hypothetical protein D0T11_04040 [Hymenobacter rubripertinctus]